MQLHDLSVAEVGRRLRSGDLTSLSLTNALLDRIRRFDPSVRAFVRVTGERALADAERADREIADGIDRGPMHGIPYALKDIYDVGGLPTTCHSYLRLGHIASEDSHVVQQLRQGGAVLLGKLTTHEFALGGPSFDLPYPPARNPWNVDYIPGASSSGSGAAVASGFSPVTMGSDTSGSVRGPAFHCGVVGLKPTYGLVSRRGTFPLSFSLDHCGPLVSCVEDAALVLQSIAGNDPLDPGSAARPLPDYSVSIRGGVEGMRIAYPRSFAAEAEGVSPEVVAALDRAAWTLATLGAEVQEIEFPDFSQFNACGRIIMAAESFAIHEANIRTYPTAFGRYTYQRVLPGAFVPASDLINAHRLRRELTLRTDAIMRPYRAVLCASSLAPAARFTDFPPDWPPPRFASATQTIVFNVTGHPALGLPIGFTQDGLPIGVQLAAKHFDEATLFRVGIALESAIPMAVRRPRLEDPALDTSPGRSG